MAGVVGGLEQALVRLRPRGPDAVGEWRSPDGLVTFGHTRLSVVETTAAGSQPMRSECGRYVIIFNGELYNHLQVRDLLGRQGRAPSSGWRGNSDTETLVASLAAWGLEETLDRVTGMFAFAAWDTKERTLLLARDALGEKPLYVARVGTGIAFASELKALVHLPAFDKSIDEAALADYLEFGYTRAPSSIYSHCSKLLPGTFVRISEADVRSMGRTGDFLGDHRRPFWRLKDAVERARQAPFQGGPAEAVAALRQVLMESVRSQMVADVPLGAFLSGGIDSTAVVAAMQAQSANRIKTFTIGFDDPQLDESRFAQRVASHLGTDHTCVMMSERDLLERVPRIPQIWDEPFADSSQLPTLLLAEVARQRVTVSLSGDGGDELFSGYERYAWLERTWPKLRRVARPLRAVPARLVRFLPRDVWDRSLSVLPGKMRLAASSARLDKLSYLFSARSSAELYARSLSSCDPGELLEGGDQRGPMQDGWRAGPRFTSLREPAMFRDLLDYLPDDVLVKVDRAAMSASLETRAPFLNPAVVQFAWSLPLSLKYRDGVSKWVLRALVNDLVPDEELHNRPKAGFGVPLAAWLRGPLRDWARDLLLPSSLERNGLRPRPIHRAWQEHASGRENHQYFLWNVLMYQAWVQHNRA